MKSKRQNPTLTDDENPELTPEQIRGMRPASEVLPRELYDSLVAGQAAHLATRGGAAMKEPGLYNRHRDANGRIQQKRSDTLNKNLSHPVPGFGPNTTLGKMREATGQTSESRVRQAAEKKPR